MLLSIGKKNLHENNDSIDDITCKEFESQENYCNKHAYQDTHDESKKIIDDPGCTTWTNISCGRESTGGRYDKDGNMK